MKSQTKKLEQLTEDELETLLSTPQNFDRILNLQGNMLNEVREDIHHIWEQIKDREETAARWLSVLIVLGLLQLFPFANDIDAKNYLILGLPSFVIAFYAAALTLSKHPNYLRTNFFVTEEADKITRYHKNDAEIKAYQKIHENLVKSYKRKRQYSGYIGLAVIVNFTANILYIVVHYFFGTNISLPAASLIAIVSLLSIYFINKIGPNKSFSITYKQDAAGNRTLEEE
jgi:hypothetical protein